jgi:hypothetical protein
MCKGLSNLQSLRLEVKHEMNSQIKDYAKEILVQHVIIVDENPLCFLKS